MMKHLLSRRTYRDFAFRIVGGAEPKSIIVSTAWQIVEKAFRLSSALTSGVLIARYLQPEQYGVYNYALAFVSFFVAVSRLGTNQIFVRDLVKKPDLCQEIVSSAFSLRLLSGLLFYVLAVGTSFAFTSDAFVRALIVIFSLQIIFRASEAIEFAFESKLEYKYITLSRSIASIFSSILIVVLIVNENSILLLAIASSSEYLVSLFIIAAAYALQKQSFEFRISLKRTKSVLSDSWPLILSGIAITVYMRIDQVMINDIAGSKELGLYSAAVQLTEVFYLFPIAFIRASFPAAIRLKGENEDLFHKSLQSLYNKVSIMSYACIVFVSMFSHRIVNILYGAAYDNATPIVNLLVWSVLFVTLGVARSTLMISMNWTFIHLNTVAIASVVNVLLNFLLIPVHGAFGAAIATVFSFWIATHGSCFLFKPLHRTGIMIMKSFVLLS